MVALEEVLVGSTIKGSFGEIQGFSGEVIAETRSDDGTRRITGVKVARALFALDTRLAAHQVECYVLVGQNPPVSHL